MKQTNIDNIDNIEATILDKMSEYTAKTANRPTQLIVSTIPYYRLKSLLLKMYGVSGEIQEFSGMTLTVLRTDATIVEVG